MKGLRCAASAARTGWGAIHLADKCLLVILLLLMVQSAVNLFWNEAATAGGNSIDVVVRTSAAGIFGYLISANFNHHRKKAVPAQVQAGAAGQSLSGAPGAATKAQIGFQGATPPGLEGRLPGASPPASRTRKPDCNCDRAQVVVIAAVGIASLCILLVFRNLWQAGTANTGSLTQFRDFVSGSVGFLISCSTAGSGGED